MTDKLRNTRDGFAGGDTPLHVQEHTLGAYFNAEWHFFDCAIKHWM